jgi:ABC-type uncharacterized transport system involved in gliding motility auxiliary subunit
VTLRLFYSRRLGAELPQYGAYAERVRDLLREYVTASRGRLRLELLDPEPFSEAEDRAVARGLQGVPLDQGGRAGLLRPRRQQRARRGAAHPLLPAGA